MAQEKLSLTQILGCIDFGYSNAWQEFTEDERKSVTFWTLNRYASSVGGSRANQERALIVTNEVFNKNYISINLSKHNGHHELMWKLLCICGSTNTKEYHRWLGFSKKTSNKIKTLQAIYPELKEDEVRTLAEISTDKQVKQLAESHGI